MFALLKRHCSFVLSTSRSTTTTTFNHFYYSSHVYLGCSPFPHVYTLSLSYHLTPSKNSLVRFLSTSCSSSSSSSPLPPFPSSSPFLNTPSLPSKSFIDLKNFIQNAEIHAENLRQRDLKLDLDIPSLVHQAKLYLTTQRELHSLQHQLNTLSELYPTSHDTVSEGNSKQELVNQAKKIKSSILTLQRTLDQLESTLHKELTFLPNFSSPFTPIGPSTEAKCLKLLGPSIDQFQYQRDHMELCQYLDLVDFIAGSKVTGTSFYFLKRAGALLELALIQFAMKLAQEHGFIPISPPDLIRSSIVKACGFQPRDPRLSQIYSVVNKGNSTKSTLSSSSFSNQTNTKETFNEPNELNEDVETLALAATAELPLAGMYANTLIPFHQLPLKLVAFGRAFRAESGARGSDTRGLYRVHQFSKVELFILSSPEEQSSLRCFEDLLHLQSTLIEHLGLTVRLMEMPTQELGASAYRKVDMEAWFPGRQAWGEISSTSHCTDYQSKKLNIRTPFTTTTTLPPSLSSDSIPPPKQRKSNHFVHTLNGTCAAIPRLIIAILEQMQQKDGSVIVPKVLQPYLQMEVIQPPTKN